MMQPGWLETGFPFNLPLFPNLSTQEQNIVVRMDDNKLFMKEKGERWRGMG
jgi:hypothetical protein